MAGGRRVRSIAALLVLMLVPVVLPAATTVAGKAPNAPATRVALDAIASCLNRLTTDADVGYERIAARCPGLGRRLEEGGWSAWLPRDWRHPGNDLSAGGLRELQKLLLATPASTGVDRPNADTLPAVLAALTQQGTARGGWWARTKIWLREVFERRQADEDQEGLSGFISQNGMSEAILELVSAAGLVVVVVLALLILGNELHAGGVFSRLRKRVVRQTLLSSGGAAAGEVSWDDVQKGPLPQQPRLLLELIIARLKEADRLPAARALTVRELTRTARLSDEADRERLAGLAWMSERVRFSNDEIPGEAIAAVVESGRTLLERIAPPPDEPHAGHPRP